MFESSEECFRLRYSMPNPGDYHANTHFVFLLIQNRCQLCFKGFFSSADDHFQRSVPFFPVSDGIQYRFIGTVQHIRTIDFRDYVSCLQSSRISRTGCHHIGNIVIISHTCSDTVYPEKNRSHHKCQHKIHQRAGKNHTQPLPHVLLREGTGIILGFSCCIILTIKSAESAQRNRTDTEVRIIFPAFPAHNLRTHSNGKFPYVDLHRPGRQEMPEFMYRNQYRQKQQRQ